MDIDTKRSSIIEIVQEKREPGENENESWTIEEIPSVSCLDTENKLPTIVQKPQEEKSSNEKEIEKRTIKGVLSHLGETSSLHGISKLASSRQVIVKLIWCCVFIVTCIVFVVQIYELFKTFYSYPVQTTVKLDFSSLAFPAITICNINPIKNGKLSMVPDIEAVLQNEEQTQSISGRKKREATMTQTLTDRSKLIVSSDEDDIETTKRPHKLHQKKTRNNAKEMNVQSVQSETLSSDQEKLSRRKRSFDPSSLSLDGLDPSLLPGNLDPSLLLGNLDPSLLLDVSNLSLSLDDLGQLIGPSLTPPFSTVPDVESTTNSVSSTDSLPTSSPAQSLPASVNNLWQLFHDNANTNHNWLTDALDETFFLSRLNLKKDQWEERIENFGIVFKNESVEKRQEIGHQKDDLIVSTTFAGRIQNSTNYKHFPSTLYGNCYTITSPKYVALGSGPAHGIKLTINLEKDDYVPNLSTGYGARVVFHEPGIHPLPSHEGITLGPGTETSIGLRMVRISRLGEPHGNCDDGIKFFQRYNRRYSIAACHEFCRIRKITEKCDCIPVDAPDGIDLNSTALPVCDTRLQSVEACLVKIDIHFDSSDFGCNCKGPCNESLFTKTMSTSYWPTDDYLSVLMTEMCEMYKTPYWVNLCEKFQYMPLWEVERFRHNFLRMTVYFEDLNYESITEEPLYERVRFLSDIGGASGLFLGASVISFVEVLQLLLELFLILKANYIDKRKARVLPQNYTT